MTRFRLITTLVVLATGATMAVLYSLPDKPAAPERIDAATILPEPAAIPVSLNEDSPATPARFEMPEPAVAPPTVALPSGPLLRSATTAPPIETSAVNANPEPVRHDLDGGSLAVQPAPLTAAPIDDAATALATQSAPKAAARPAPRRPKPRPRTAHKSKKIEQLFLNPLGSR